jgi:hypothetical protein
MKTVISKNGCLATLPLWGLLFQLLQPCALDAQTVVAPVSQVSTTPAALQDILGVKPDESSLDSVLATIATEPPIDIGPVKLLPHFFYRVLYGNGIQPMPGHPLKTAVNSFSPGLLTDFGRAWTFDYTPTWNVYSNSQFKNGTDQEATLKGVAVVDQWTLQFSQDYLSSTQPLVETGMQTSEKDYDTAFSASRELTPGMILDTSFAQDLRYVVGYPESLGWSTTDWLGYQVAPTFNFGFGGGLGYVEAGEGTNTFYYSPQVRMTFNATQKITVNLNGGIEHQEFLGTFGATRNDPIYNLSVVYSPSTTTKLGLNAGEQVDTAFQQSETTRSSVVGATLEQRFLEHYFLSAGVNEIEVNYLSSLNAGASVRRDRDLSYNLRLSTLVLGRATLAVLYQAGTNSSNLPGFGFSTNQVGFEFGYRF